MNFNLENWETIRESDATAEIDMIVPVNSRATSRKPKSGSYAEYLHDYMVELRKNPQLYQREFEDAGELLEQLRKLS